MRVYGLLWLYTHKCSSRAAPGCWYAAVFTFVTCVRVQIQESLKWQLQLIHREDKNTSESTAKHMMFIDLTSTALINNVAKHGWWKRKWGLPCCFLQFFCSVILTKMHWEILFSLPSNSIPPHSNLHLLLSEIHWAEKHAAGPWSILALMIANVTVVNVVPWIKPVPTTDGVDAAKGSLSSCLNKLAKDTTLNISPLSAQACSLDHLYQCSCMWRAVSTRWLQSVQAGSDECCSSFISFTDRCFYLLSWVNKPS